MTSFQPADRTYIIADRAHIKGTVRSGTAALRQVAHQRLHDIVSGVAKIHRGEADLHGLIGEPPVNDPEMVALIERAGGDKVIRAPGWTVADDFDFYSEKRSAVYFRLGVRNADVGAAYPLHPIFTVDEAALSTGANTLLRLALDFLTQQY